VHAALPRPGLAARATERLRGLVQPRIWLERHGRDRYRRTLAIVRDRAGRDLAQVMIREGLARPYNGRGRRQGWCDWGVEPEGRRTVCKPSPGRTPVTGA
jgi:endonuclease YncB( thermonuclease family)